MREWRGEGWGGEGVEREEKANASTKLISHYTLSRQYPTNNVMFETLGTTKAQETI